MDVRIGLTYSARELEVELADDTDVDALQGRGRARSLADDDAVLWLTDSKGSQVGVAGRQGRLRRRSAPPATRAASASAAERPSPTVPRSAAARPAAAVRHRQGRRRQDDRRRRPGLLAAEQGKRTLVCEVDAKGNLADFFEAGPTPVRAPRGRSPNLLRHDDGHRGVAEGVPPAPAQAPARRPASARWPAPSTSWPTPRPGVKEILTVGKFCWEVARAALRPRRRRRRRHRPRRRPAAPRRRRISELVQGRAWCASRPAGCSTSSATPPSPAR